jgi:hypothetical protein
LPRDALSPVMLSKYALPTMASEWIQSSILKYTAVGQRFGVPLRVR